MRISAKAEYACAAMLELAARFGNPHPLPISTIADSQGIPGRFLVQILLQLKTAGLVTSVRGTAGGYQLSRSPETITLAAIINAIDERTVMPSVALNKANHTPTVEVLLSVWQEISAQEQRILERITLSELLQRTQANNGLSYQI